MSATSFEIYSKEHASGEKFDYYICSAAAALFAYIGQTYTPHIFDSWYYYIMPSALLALTACFGIGLWTISMSKKVTRINKDHTMKVEENNNLLELLNNSQKDKTFKNSRESTSYTYNDLVKTVESNRKIIDDKFNVAANLMNKANFLNCVRNLLLGIGFILIFLAKVFQPYFQQVATQPK